MQADTKSDHAPEKGAEGATNPGNREADGVFAATPPPPYYAVIFTRLRTPGDNGYGAEAERMVKLVEQQPGYLGVESVASPDGAGITVAYFSSLEAIAGWKQNAEHLGAQAKGRDAWYAGYEVRVARVERAYGFRRPQ